MPLFEYPGALHIHSTHSDGTATIPQIADAARQAGLRWILISDHDTLAGLEQGEAGWYDGLAVLVGYEITPDDHHYLVLGLDEVIPCDLLPAEYVAQVRERGGWGFVLHPDEQAGSYFKPPFPWRERTIRGFNGIEIWNYMSEWTEGLTRRNRYPRFALPFLAIRGPTQGTLAWWDELLAAGERVAAVAGLDTHATRYRLLGRFPVEVFPYRRQFGTLVNHIVLRRPLSSAWSEAAQQIGEALAGGRAYLAYEALGRARGFRFLAQRAGQVWTMGETVPPTGEVTLTVRSPRWGQIRLLHNGRPVRRAWGKNLRLPVQEPGSYRVEVYRFGRPWLYGNPIYLA